MKLARAILIVAVTLTAAACGANALARLIGGERGTMAGVIAACMVTLLTSHWHRRPRRQPQPEQPAEADLPGRELVKSPT